MNIRERRERLRAILAGDQCIYTAPVYDMLSLRMAEDLGFGVAFMTDPNAQITVVGAPNHHIVVLTATELAQHVWSMIRATNNISLYIGSHHGFGNALNVMRTVQELERAGVSAMTVDDMVEPSPFGTRLESWTDYHTYVEGGERLLPLDEAVGKMRAAVAAREDSNLIIVARTSALRAGTGNPDVPDVVAQRERISAGAPGPGGGNTGIPEAIRRIKAYEKAGVDGIHIDGAIIGGLEEIRAETKLPLLLGDEAALYDKDFLSANGVRIGGFGRLTLVASIKAVYDVLKALSDGKSPREITDTIYSPEVLTLLSQVTRVSQYDQWMKDFMT